MREIEKLAQRWEWQDESKFLNIGTPLELIECLRNGCFQVKVNERVRKMKAGKINRSREYRRELFGHNVDQNENLDDKVTWEEVSPRNIVINNFGTYKEIKICGQLQEVCSVLLEKLSERMYIQPPVEISVNIFYSNFDWFKLKTDDVVEDDSVQDMETPPAHIYPLRQESDTDVDDPDEINENQMFPSEIQRNHPSQRLESEDEEINGIYSIETKSKASELMDELLKSMPEPVIAELDVRAVTKGFLLFVEHLIEEKTRNEEVSLEQAYKRFYQKYRGLHDDFKILFEKIQLKSFSEALCETIGSQMKMALGKDRHLEPENFSKEIVIAVNLPPIHILKQKFIPELVDQLLSEKIILFNELASGPLSYVNKLKSKDPNLSSSLYNHRNDEERKCKLPMYPFL